MAVRRCRIVRRCAGLGALAGAALLAGMGCAAAQFSSLEGYLRCIDQPSLPECRQRFDPPPAPPAPAAKPVVPEENPTVPPAPAKEPAAKAPAPPKTTPLAEILGRVRDGTASPQDITRLAALSDGGDGAATALLAWCAWRGIARPADPLLAYRLYRKAAGIGIPGAAEGQRLVFEESLDGEQRNTVLTEENSVRK
jgi:hypothetical protein